MANATPSRFAPRIAECGHYYESYTFLRKARRYCPPCVKERVAGYRSGLLSISTQQPHISAEVRRFVYERDGWLCQLCFEPVDAALQGSRDMMGPSIDHIICVSWVDVSDDSPANLRLAHRLCNLRRGNRAA